MSSKAHSVAVKAFNSNHASYDLLRPDFNPIVVDKFLKDLGLITEKPQTNKVILELAAGTGKFTKNLVDHGWKDNLFIVEPSEGMLTSFKKNFPGITTYLGSSYEIPLQDKTVDAVIIAQGFHWFADSESLKEINRVLKPNGSFGCIWNFDGPSPPQKAGKSSEISYIVDDLLKDEISIDKNEDPFEVSTRLFDLYKCNQRITDYLYSFDVTVPQYRRGAWKPLLEDNEYFKPTETETFFYRKFNLPKDLVYQYWLTRSYITKLSDEEKAKVEKTVNDIIQEYGTGNEVSKKDGVEYLQRVLGTHTITTTPK